MREHRICDILKLYQGHLSRGKLFFFPNAILNPAYLTLFKMEQNQMLSSPYLPSGIFGNNLCSHLY